MGSATLLGVFLLLSALFVTNLSKEAVEAKDEPVVSEPAEGPASPSLLASWAAVDLREAAASLAKLAWLSARAFASFRFFASCS